MKTLTLFVKCAAALALTCGIAGNSHAFVVFNVDTTKDELDFVECTPQTPNHCSLRSAIIWANQVPGLDTIVLPPGTYPLTLTGEEPLTNPTALNDLDILDSLVIRGAGSAKTIIDGSSKMRIIDINDVKGKDQLVILEDLGLRGGRIEGLVFEETEGAAIHAYSGFPHDFEDRDELLINRVRISSNVLDGMKVSGAALSSSASATWILNSEIDSNHMFGEESSRCALMCFGFAESVVIQNTRIHKNTMASKAGSMVLFGFVDDAFWDRNEMSSNIASNQVVTNGSFGGRGLSITNSTFSGNAGKVLWNGTEMRLTNVTITNNNKANLSHNASTVWNEGKADMTFKNSIIAKQKVGSDCHFDFPEEVNSLGNNIDSDGSCKLNLSSDHPGIDPKLGILQANGGVTLTHMPAAISAAIDNGESLPNLTVDQRGFSRPIGNSVDIGAVERNILIPIPPQHEEQ